MTTVGHRPPNSPPVVSVGSGLHPPWIHVFDKSFVHLISSILFCACHKKQSIDLSRICNPMKNHATLSSNNLYSWNDITRRIFQLRLSNANLIIKPCNNIEVNNDSMSIPFMIRYYLSLYKASTIHIIFQRQQCGNLHWNGPFTGQ